MEKLPNPNDLVHLILAGEANRIAVEVRRAASDCQNAVAKLTERDQISPDRLVQFSTSVSEMLVCVVRIRDTLASTDRRIQKVRSTDRELRRLQELPELIEEAQEKSRFTDEKALRRELTVLEKTAGPKRTRLKADVVASLMHRLELLRYWSWFIKQAICLYAILTEAIVINLGALKEALPEDDELRASIDAIIGDRPRPAISESIKAGNVPDDFDAIHAEVVEEIKTLMHTQRSLDKTREESRELENTEVLLKEEIIDQSTEDGTSAPNFDDIVPMFQSKATGSTSRMVYRKNN